MTEHVGRFADGTVVRVRTVGGRIAEVDAVTDGRDASGAGDLPWLLPGFVDLQVNGYGGIDLNADDLTPEVVHGFVRAVWRQGVTTVFPTLITAPAARIVDGLSAISRARAEDVLTRHSIVGIHLEGPYLSGEDGPRGAHDAAHIRPPDLAELERWLAAAGDARLLVTLAPETDGAIEFIRAATDMGVIIALGHTAATPETIHAAAAAGARLATHLGNGAHPLMPRHPNYIWAQLADDRLTASLVADGHHLPIDTFVAMTRAKGAARTVLVSDSVALAGCEPGDYTTTVGGAVTLHPGGRLTLAGSQLLAGSAASLADCVSWAVHQAGLDLASVTPMAAANPARLVGLEDRGTVSVGAVADLTLLSPDLRDVWTVVVDGEVVHDEGPRPRPRFEGVTT